MNQNQPSETPTSDSRQRENPSAHIAWPAPFLDLMHAVASQKRVCMIIVAIGVLLGVIRILTLPAVYTASAVAVLLPREKPIFDAAVDTSSIEATDDRAGRGSAGSLMLPPNPTLYTTLINSRAVLSQISRKFNERLQGHLSPRDRSDEVIGQVKSMVSITSTEEGIITVTVASRDPELSADIANELFEECRRASKSIERQLILQQAGHLENALSRSSERLGQTEAELSAYTARHGLVDVSMQANNQLRTMRELLAEKDKLNTDLQELLLSYTDRSPEVIALRTRIEAVERQMTSANTNIIGSVGAEEYGKMVVVHKSLEQKIRFERDLVATLATKADIYRLRAEEPTGNLAVIRRAVAPARPSGPSKKKELGLMLGISVVLSLTWSVGCQQWKQARKDDYLSSRMAEIAHLLLPARMRKRMQAAPQG